MRYSKRYVILTAILLVTFLAKLNTWNDEYADVTAFRGAQLQDEVFYPLKARSINEEGLVQLTVGEETYGVKDGVMLGDHMQVMASLPFVQDFFGCSASLYENQKISLDYGDTNYTFYINSIDAKRGEKAIALDVMPELHEGQAYLSLQDLCREFGCEYSYDEINYQATITGKVRKGVLPKSYDLRQKERVSAVRNQKNTSTCWAQAALSALESTLLPEEKTAFDTDRMIEHNAYQVDSSLGGNYMMAVSYLVSWMGPDKDGTKSVDKHVQEVHFYNSDDIDEIKWAVYQHGGVSTSIYAKVSTSNLSKSSYYNKKKNAYCYKGTEKPNHDVVIIGWDDQYSASNFTGKVPGNGAFICQNSWGATFGENGVFYVSYYDTNIGEQAVSYVRAESTDNYDTIYQSDLCGWVGQVGYNKEKIHAANIYEAQADEKIESAGFYALGKNTTYQLYVVTDYRNTASLASRVEVARGTLVDAGYYTIPFDHAYSVKEGEKFAIVVVLSTPGMNHPMAIEYAKDALTKHVTISDGEGYISNNGLDWESVEDTAKGNLCLKAYGKKVEQP
ncbi:MAG: cell surface protein [Pseudobutyrivibrio sp.]|nr:cell surface protein [Pseudobutyrivibrio sp.]